METSNTVGLLLDWMKSWPVAVLLLAASLIALGIWVARNVPLRKHLDAIEEKAETKNSDLAILNAAQHKAMTDGFQQQLERLTDNIGGRLDKSNADLRETLRLNDLNYRETIGRAHERIDKLAEGFAALRGEHLARAAAGARCIPAPPIRVVDADEPAAGAGGPS